MIEKKTAEMFYLSALAQVSRSALENTSKEILPSLFWSYESMIFCMLDDEIPFS